jgi:hypothetical protein
MSEKKHGDKKTRVRKEVNWQCVTMEFESAT